MKTGGTSPPKLACTRPSAVAEEAKSRHSVTNFDRIRVLNVRGIIGTVDRSITRRCRVRNTNKASGRI